MFSKVLAPLLILSSTLLIVEEVRAGNDAPYGVSLTGFRGGSKGGQGAAYAGSAIVAPLASEGFNSPNARSTQSNAFQGDPTGTGFGGFGWSSGGNSQGGYGGGASSSSSSRSGGGGSGY